MTSNGKDFERLWTVCEIAEYYQICTKTVRKKLVQLEVPTVLIGRQIRVRASHVPLLAKKKW